MSKPKKEPSRFVNLKDARAILSRLLTDAQTKPVVIMRHGKPSVILQGVEGQSIEQVMAEVERGS
jgi:PHD/YefM family antitoxin component YafN of YafNO toxin-antitoxin module